MAESSVTSWPAVDSNSIEIAECGEALVAIDDDMLCLNMYRAAGWPGTGEHTWVRVGVRARLLRVIANLPTGLALAVFDGWRSPTTVRALHDHYYAPGSTLAPGFVADPDDPNLVPPHLTGGAVDLTLARDGVVADMGTAFDDFTGLAAASAFEADGTDAGVRDLRRELHTAMRVEGFTGYWAEWWHFSYGDQEWAAATGHDSAHYGIRERAELG